MSEFHYDPFSVDAAAPVPETPDFNEGRAVYDEPNADENAVPDGSTKEVLDWVDGDSDRAQQALDAENSKDKPRKGLVNELNELIEK